MSFRVGPAPREWVAFPRAFAPDAGTSTFSGILCPDGVEPWAPTESGAVGGGFEPPVFAVGDDGCVVDVVDVVGPSADGVAGVVSGTDDVVVVVVALGDADCSGRPSGPPPPWPFALPPLEGATARIEESAPISAWVVDPSSVRGVAERMSVG